MWRRNAVNEARRLGLPFFNDGIAPKLINYYLKTRYVCGGFHEHASVGALHPPIDALLLDGLANVEKFNSEAKVWRDARKKRWSNLNSDDYEAVIQAIRRVLQGKPLWLIGEYWRGHQ